MIANSHHLETSLRAAYGAYGLDTGLDVIFSLKDSASVYSFYRDLVDWGFQMEFSDHLILDQEFLLDPPWNAGRLEIILGSGSCPGQHYYDISGQLGPVQVFESGCYHSAIRLLDRWDPSPSS